MKTTRHLLTLAADAILDQNGFDKSGQPKGASNSQQRSFESKNSKIRGTAPSRPRGKK